jgi:hypothetical protein
MAGRLILDSGALIGCQRNDPNVWRYVATIDVLVAAEAIRGGPCLVLTGDPDDLASLVGGHPYIRIVAV